MLRADGKHCYRCLREAELDGVLCARCRAKKRAWYDSHLKRSRAPAQSHSQRSKAYNARQLQKGLCVCCPEQRYVKPDGSVSRRCRKHHEKKAEKGKNRASWLALMRTQQERRAKGLCMDCGGQTPVNAKGVHWWRCEHCSLPGDMLFRVTAKNSRN